MIRFRWPVVGVWLIVLVLGNFAGFGLLPSRLSDEFTVPGTDSETVRTILRRHFGDNDNGNYLVVVRVFDSDDPAAQTRLKKA